MAKSSSSVGAREYGGRKRRGLAWLPWLLLLLLALIALGIYLLIHNLSDDDNNSSTSNVTDSAASSATGQSGAGQTTTTTQYSGALVGGAGLAALPATGSSQAASATPVIGTVLFAANSAAVDATGMQIIQNAVDLAQTRGAKTLTVTGYTDVVGNQPVNDDLSQSRADAVAAQLRTILGAGVSVTTASKGEQDPVASNTNNDGTDNPAGRQQNRRAVIAIK